MTDLTDLNARLAALEERMNTERALVDQGLEHLERKLAEHNAARAARETWLVVFLVATGIIASGLAIAILAIAIPGVLIGQ